ncbi:putative acetyltransferase [Marinomonas spartinae]|uniref:Putative acetyltransferase n=2 Tax=Marinomonas spartinae TaxID=1792290 RepID=A0A1A8TEY1_9GAMM|nr:putative acetyltransferase [Marinomonas spartinae]
MKIRQANVADIDALVELSRQIGEIHYEKAPHTFMPPSPEEKAFLLKALEGGEYHFLVAEHEGSVIGFINARIMINESIPFIVKKTVCRIGTIVVDESHRSCGVGEALMKACYSWAIESGATSIRLEVMAFNERAKAFYQKLGYVDDFCIMSRQIA